MSAALITRLRSLCLALTTALACSTMATAGTDDSIEGVITDARTHLGVALAHVGRAEVIRRTDNEGHFSLPASASASASGPQVVSVRAPGYLRQQVTLPASSTNPVRIELQPFRAKALYLSAYGIGSTKLRGDALQLIDQTELNALVIDVKDDRGMTPYRSAALAAAGLPPQKIVTVPDMPALLRSLHERGIYLIARIVVFKDQRLVTAHPQWAVRRANGSIWVDNEGLSWLDASNPSTWDLSLSIALEAAQMGFDEIQFDYVRFPDATGLRFAQTSTQENRTAAISGFLDAARQRLAPYNVYLSADIFGYVCWNTNDTAIGQQLEMLSDRVDYLSPMLYPSGFTWGIPGHTLAVASPYEIVDHSLREALNRTGLDGVRWRPWLQAFRDYAFDHRVFGATEIRAQIDASEKLGSGGWMLWNARNSYSSNGLKLNKPAESAKP
jgi:hypothetical protein